MKGGECIVIPLENRGSPVSSMYWNYGNKLFGRANLVFIYNLSVYIQSVMITPSLYMPTLQGGFFFVSFIL